MSAADAQKLAAEVMTVRRSHPHAPALDVLDLVIKGRHQLPDFGESRRFMTDGPSGLS